MNNISFANPYLLLIAVPLVVLFTVPFCIAVRKDNANAHNITSQVLHILMAFIIAFAAAGTTITAVLTETDVYVVADVSYSANKNLDLIDKYIKDISLPGNAKIGLVCFGKDYKLVSDLGSKSKLASVKNSGVDDTETNIAEALSYAGTLFEDDVIKRIVLITDGKQTDETDSYAVNRAINSLQSRDIKVDAIYIDDNLEEGAKEVQISGVDYTRSVFINREERAMVFVQSSYETDAILSLYKGETKLTDRPVKLMQGSNPVTFNLDTTSAGTFDYRVTISAEGDISSYNNAYSFTQIVSPERRVLAITGNWNDCPALVEMYKDSGAYIDVYEKEVANDTDHTPTALREKRAYRDRYAADDRINIHLMSDTQNYVIQPWSIEELCAYDEIVLSDIDISTLENSTEFVNNLDIAVSMFGKSLITLGNLRIQNAGVSDLATLGEMLPVRYGRSDNLPKLYTIVIDASRSMTNDWGNFQSAQSAATRLLDLMSEGDCVNIVSFDQNTHINITESAVKDRDYIEGVINGLEPTQGTDIGTALQAAYDLNTDANRFSERRVILISDGINYTGDSTSTISALAAGAFAEGVTTSVIDVGRRGDNADGSNSSAGASAARNLLMDIAEKGSGSADSAAYFYLGASDELSDEIFVQISERLYESIVERSAPVDVVRRSDEVLDGFPRTGVPDISGYVYCSSRDNAMNVLELTHVRPDTGATEKVPLYSYWSRGNGKVATFTSALSRDWLGAWETRDIENLFITNVLDVNTPAQKSDYPYVFSVLQEGAMTTVKITPATLRFYSTAKISIEAPDGQITEDVMVFDGTEYSYNFDTADVGKYTVNVTYGYNDKEYTATAPVTVSYKSEYDAFTLYEPSVLSRALGGKVSLDGKLSLENAANEAGTYTLELTIPLLITCAVLYVVDIVIRKLKWEDVKSFFASFKKSAKEEGGKS